MSNFPVQVPNVGITQTPIGDLIEGTSVVLQCSATVSLPISLTFSINIYWINDEIGNLSNNRIFMQFTEQEMEFISILTITAVDAELDASYSCVAGTVIEEQGEFLTSQPATSTLSLVVIGEYN